MYLIDTEQQLTEVLTRPRPVLVDFVRSLVSPLVVLRAYPHLREEPGEG